MTSSHSAPSATPSTARRAASFAAPLISTLITLPLAFFAHFITVLSAAGVEDTTGSSAGPPVHAFQLGLLIPLCLLVSAWAVPVARDLGNRRILFSFLAPLSVVLLTLAVLVALG